MGILAPRGEAQARQQWQPTLEALSEAVPRARFEAKALTLDGVIDAVAHQQVEFVLTNPGQFVLLDTPYSLSWLATRRSNPAESARESLGSVLLVRGESRYTRVDQLAGQRVTGVHEQAFGGYLLLLPRLQEAEIRPEDFQLDFAGYPVDALVYQLRDGQTDAIILPTCMLEQMADEGLVDRQAFRALLAKGAQQPCLSSTVSYPDWTFAALPHVSETLAGDVARGLLGMDGSGLPRWGAPVSAARVATLFDELELHPLTQPLSGRLAELIRQFWHYLALAGLLLVAGLAYHGWIHHLAHRHARDLETAQLALRDRERSLADAQRRDVSSELAATLAHEINQPLAAIRHYAEGGLLRLDRTTPESPLREPLERIGTEAARGARIIEQARNWIRSSPPPFETLSVEALFDASVEMARPRLAQRGVEIAYRLSEPGLTLGGNRLAMEQVLGNLIGNSLDAFAEAGRGGWITLGASRMAAVGDSPSGWVRLSVNDNAGGFEASRLEAPFAPLESSRRDGLGLGLAICRRLIERQGGTLSLTNHTHGGARVILDLPATADPSTESRRQ